MSCKALSLLAMATMLPVIMLSEPGRAETYKQVSIDEDGQLHIVLDTGKEILPEKLPEQVAFDAPAISPTTTWLAGWQHTLILTMRKVVF